MSHNFGISFGALVWNKVLHPLIRSNAVFAFCANWYSYVRRILITKPVDISITKNLEGFNEWDIDLDWFTRKKPLGISGVARLKNSADFLKLTVESFLPYLDEIILVAEESADDTIEICKQLSEEYPSKVKFFFYPHKVRFRDYDGDSPPLTNSIHSFAYFTNWAFSKTSFSHVMRLDDDILPIPEIWEKLRHMPLDSSQKYVIYSGINVLKREDRIGAMKLLPLCGTGGDNGIYPVNEYTYFTQIPGGVEVFHSRLFYERVGVSFLHLKNLKSAYGTSAYFHSDGGKWYRDFVESSEISEFHDYCDFPVSKIYAILVKAGLL